MNQNSKPKIQNLKLILGIETSCDETSVAVVKNGRKVLSCEIATSIPLHQETKGVVPEVAARAQVEAMIPVLDRALNNAKATLDDIDLIAVTEGPGLVGSLLVGISTANTLATILQKPVVGVPHIWGHMHAVLLETGFEPNFPVLVLTVSGGHNDLYLWKGFGDFEKLGQTLDDSAGEAFDKCGRLLGLGYPAGPQVSKLAETGNKQAFDFPRSMAKSDNYNFSFSGLKTSFLYALEKMEKAENKEYSHLSQKVKADLAASLQEAICESLWLKAEKALKEYKIKEVHLAGGVSANTRLRELFTERLNKNIVLRYAQNIKYCTDNAAMIASTAYFCTFKSSLVDVKLF